MGLLGLIWLRLTAGLLLKETQLTIFTSCQMTVDYTVFFEVSEGHFCRVNYTDGILCIQF